MGFCATVQWVCPDLFPLLKLLPTFSILGESMKPSAKAATAVLGATLISAAAFLSGSAGTANAAPKGNVVPADYTCPAASATAPACMYYLGNFNDDIEPPYYPNSGYGSWTGVFGVRNRNTRYYLCMQNRLSGGVIHISPYPHGDVENVDNLGGEGFGAAVKLWFHSSADCGV